MTCLTVSDAITVTEAWAQGRAPSAHVALRLFKTFDRYPELVAIIHPSIRQDYLTLKNKGIIARNGN